MNVKPEEPPSQDPPDLLAQVANLQAELQCLRERYDALLEAKNRVAARYKADYKKWRNFKRWLLEDKKASTLGKRKQFEVFGPDLHELSDEEECKWKEREKEKGQTKGVSHRASFCEFVDWQRRSTFCVLCIAYTGSQSSHRESDGGKTPKKKVLSPSLTNKDVPPSPGEGPSLVKGSTKQQCQAESSSKIAPATEPRKGRGRYAQVPVGLDTINSRFTINKDHNHGMEVQFEAVVRNRDERRHMLGGDCECCQEYYKAVGPLPAPQRPIWRSPKRRTSYMHHMSDGEKENADDEVERHKQRISRHRHHWDRAKTPPGYWDIGFPDTQEASEINRRAAEMHRRKLMEVEAEAKRGNGRYVERAS